MNFKDTQRLSSPHCWALSMATGDAAPKSDTSQNNMADLLIFCKFSQTAIILVL